LPAELAKKVDNMTALLPPELANKLGNKTAVVQMPVLYVNPEYQNIVQKSQNKKKKEIYKVKDSNSTITQWKQRDHAWSKDQHENSDEVKFVNSTI